MIKFILFVKKIHFLLIFIILESLAINYYAGSTSYTKAKIVSSSNMIVGGVYSKLSGFVSYFHLRRENEKLTQQLVELKNQIDQLIVIQQDSTQNIVLAGREYEYFGAKVINNTITKQDNYITINKGVSEGFATDMALVSNDGIIGYILRSSEHFSIAMSILNRDFKTGGKIKGGDYFGSVFWDGTSYEHVTLSEIPKYAIIQQGDTVVTDFSSRFPSGIMIGTVVDFELKNQTYYDVKVKLHSNIATLSNVVAIKYLDKGELETLEETTLNPDLY